MRKWRFLKILILLVLPSAVLLYIVSRWSKELAEDLRPTLGLDDGQAASLTVGLFKGAKTIFWLSISIVVVSVLSYFLSPELARRRGKHPMPALLRDLIRYGAFIFCAALILRWVWGEGVTPLIGALGIGGVVLGFALQETLSNFFAGLALLAEQPFDLGDWVRIGDKPEGQVEHITWRATKIRTRDNDYQIFPNSTVAKEVIVNFRQPTLDHAIRISIGTSYDDPPDVVKQSLLEVLSSVRAVLKTPAPVVYLKSYGDSSINYEVKCYVEDYERRPLIEDEIMHRIWYAFRRADIEIPFPIRTVYMNQVSPEERRPKGRVDVERVLRSTALFGLLSAEELSRLATRAHVLHFGSGEPVIRQGDPGETLFVIVSGSARIVVRVEDGGEREVAKLSAGDFFGEMSLLTGDPRTATVYADEMLVLCAVSKTAFLPILSADPTLAEKLAEIVTLRRQGLTKAQAEAALDGARKTEVQTGTRTLLGRIRSFFNI